jgi:hypothetical protein
MWIWFAASPLWWLFGLPVGAVTPLFLLWPPALTSLVAMLVVLAGGALLSRRALNY